MIFWIGDLRERRILLKMYDNSLHMQWQSPGCWRQETVLRPYDSHRDPSYSFYSAEDGAELFATQHLSEDLHALGFQSIFSFTAQISQHYLNSTAQSISTCSSCDSNLAHSPTSTGHWVCHTQKSVTDPAVACCLYKTLLIPQPECCFHDRPHSFPPHCFPLHMANQLWLNTDVPSISHLFLFLTSEAIANLLFS